MWTSLYVVLSLVVFFFDVRPLHKHMKERSDYEKNNAPVKLDFAGKLVYIAGIVNLCACAVIVLCKLFGLLEWWSA